MARIAWSVLLVLMTVGCSKGGSSDNVNTSDAEAGAPIESGAPAKDDGGQMPSGSGGTTAQNKDAGTESGTEEVCNTLEFVGQPIVPTREKGNMPDPVGGIIADGIYDLVERRVYSEEATLEPIQQTFEIAASGKRVSSVLATGGETKRRTDSLEIDGTIMKMTPACPAELVGKGVEGGYFSAFATELWLFSSNSVLVHRKR